MSSKSSRSCHAVGILTSICQSSSDWSCFCCRSCSCIAVNACRSLPIRHNLRNICVPFWPLSINPAPSSSHLISGVSGIRGAYTAGDATPPGEMCILFLSICACPEPGAFRLVLASNRDEYYRRPTEKAHHWTDAPNVIGGRDMEPGREGGTWLAMDTSGYGRIAVLLNVMGGPADPKAKGRGFLVSDWVHSNDTAKDYIERVAEHGQEFNGFHLVAVDLSPSSIAQGVWHYSNCSEVDGVGTQVTQIREGQLSLGNSLKSRPFQKVTAGSERFRKIVQCLGRRETTDQLVQEIIKVLAWNHEHVPDEELDARGGRANMPPETRRLCSSIFQRHPSYGTRTHTIILVDSEWRCDFHEWTLEAPVNPNSSKWIHTHRQYSLGQSN